MINDERKKELQELLFQSACSWDKYYFQMTLEDFEKAILGNEELFTYYIQQRDTGFEGYREKISYKINSLSSPEEIHYLIETFNYDASPQVIEEIILNENCSIESAKTAYWNYQPLFYYDEFFGELSKCPPKKYYFPTVKLLMTIEEKVNSGSFLLNKIKKDGNSYEKPKNFDFEKKPYNKIPELLR